MKEFLNNLNIPAIIIDMFLIILILYNIIKASKQGFISSLISLILTVVDCVFVWPFSEKISKYIYNLYLKDAISKIIKTKLIDTGVTTESISDFLNKEFLSPENYLGLSLENIDNTSFFDSVSNIISDKFVFPVINILMNVIVLIIVSLMFSIIIKFSKKLFGCFSHIPVLGKFNMFLGGIFGFFKSIVVISFICLIINSLISVSEDKWSFLNSKILDETYVFKKYDELIEIDKISSFIDFIKKNF
ncbi:MAG: CvpA family protein [Oscillospiraceae bacterium]|nr:CvpA family protein [Oscillospiraceae bacterium]